MLTKKIDTRGLLINPPSTERLTAGCTILRTGEAVGEHTTENREEFLVILQGTAQVSCSGETQRVSQGHLVYIPKNQKHNVLNVGEGVLKYVFIVTPVES